MDALVNATIELPDGPVEGMALLIDGGRIRAAVPVADVPAGADRIDLGGGRIAAGFIDLQVNGGGGTLFNDDPSPEGIARIAAAHRRFGTTAMLPTVITDRLEVRRAAVDAVRAVRAAGDDDIIGIHLEGPHLSVARRGVHSAERICTPTTADIALMRSPGIGRVLTTIAPEAVDADALHAMLDTGAITAIGHTDASYEEVTEAFRMGVAGATHLFNAMSPLTARAPGAVGAVLDSPGAWAGIIADGHHVHWAVVRLAWRLLGRRLILVTDAMPPVGADSPDFLLYEEPVTVRDGRCISTEGKLAGSALDMATAVRNCVRLAGIPVTDALAMAAAAPADALGLGHERGRIATGLRADLVLLDDDLHVRRVWVGGVEQALS